VWLLVLAVCISFIRQLRRRLTAYEANIWVAVTLLISSSAIYLGRDLRWNSWDVITNPGGLLFDVSDRLQHPASYPQMLMTIFVFFIVLGSMYSLLWRGIGVLRRQSTAARMVHYIAFYGTLKRSGEDSWCIPYSGSTLCIRGTVIFPASYITLGGWWAWKLGTVTLSVSYISLKDIQLLPQLDDYEAVDNVDPTKPGFSRVLVELSKPKVLAWVYFYDGNVPGGTQLLQ
jgi:hypothetical protein